MNTPQSSIVSNKQTALLRLFPAFSAPQFRWLWGNNVLASMGRSMEMLTLGWLVLIETDSPLWVGMVAGLRGMGQVGFGLFGGVIADRTDRRKALILAQCLVALAALLLGLLVVTDNIALWSILVVALLQGTLSAVAMPLNNALIFDTVGKERLLNAMAARITAFNLARIVGAVIAGTLITTVSVGGCYLFIAGTYFFSPLFLLLMRGTYRTATQQEPIWRNARQGVSYAWRSGPLRSLLLVSVLMETFAFSYHIMLPVMARDVLHVGASGLGYLSAAGGTGALMGALTVASLGDFRWKGPLMMITAGMAGLFLLLFALSPWFAVSLVLVACVGASLMTFDATIATLLQLLSSDVMRGRIMGLYALTFGFTPLGGFLAGAIAGILGAPLAVGLGGVIILLSAARMLQPMSRVREGPQPAIEPSK